MKNEADNAAGQEVTKVEHSDFSLLDYEERDFQIQEKYLTVLDADNTRQAENEKEARRLEHEEKMKELENESVVNKNAHDLSIMRLNWFFRIITFIGIFAIIVLLMLIYLTFWGDKIQSGNAISMLKIISVFLCGGGTVHLVGAVAKKILDENI